ncbi:MAG: hypothetical protein RMM08_09730 [Armatimonadota bacterium]|nr:hypothetical protein [bacterium]MDW8321632.1 hypothetical protein [Armatimonadota bacterium]
MGRPGRSFRARKTAELLQDLLQLVGIVSAIGAMLAIAYLLWGVFSGMVTSWATLSPAERLRVEQNVHTAGRALLISTATAAASFTLLYIQQTTIGYVFLLLAAVLALGVPLGVIHLAPQTGQEPTLLPVVVVAFQQAGLLCLVPGIIFAVLDVWMRVTSGYFREMFNRSNLRYGANVARESQTSNRLLGMCWQLPFCRPSIRKSCPIYHARRACWREGVGCMCEERVILQALEGKGAPSADPRQNVRFIPYNRSLSKEEKQERCRNCIIYNHRQQQKYQVIAPIVIVAAVAVVANYAQQAQQLLFQVLHVVDNFVARFAFLPSSGEVQYMKIESLARSSEFVTWMMIGIIAVIFVSYVLRIVEYFIFQLKV